METTIINTPDIEKMIHLREQVEIDLSVSDKGPSGWSKSTKDPNRFLEIFSMLKLKDKYILRAYQYRSGGNGNGVVLAMPEHEPFPEPGECLKSTKGFLNTPRPPSALPNVMAGISGDGSPWSFFCFGFILLYIDSCHALMLYKIHLTTLYGKLY